MIEGKTVLQFSHHAKNIDGSRPKGFMELEHHVVKFKQYLEAERFPDGSVREHDLIQFYANPGGLRTIRAEDLTIL